MPRRTGLLPLELAILRVVATHPDSHGFGIASTLRDKHGAGLTAHGTLYKALSRLVAQELLTSGWEAAEKAEDAGRPRRRLYRITATGLAAVAEAATTAVERPSRASGKRPSPRTAEQ